MVNGKKNQRLKTVALPNIRNRDGSQNVGLLATRPLMLLLFGGYFIGFNGLESLKLYEFCNI